jgi:Uma2 family endonuclease
MVPRRAHGTRISYDVPRTHERWVLREADPRPEKNPHHEAIQLLELILKAWVARSRRAALVGSNLAIRWDREHPGVGVDPDVYLVEPPSPEGNDVASLLLWKRGHHAPRVAVEVVSSTNSDKDYVDAPAKYAAAGVNELWIFDPELEGPAVGGGPHVLQIYRRVGRDRFRRVHAGPVPAFSRELGAWLVTTDDGKRLRIADDAKGSVLWPTEAERERAEKERERAEKERALARLAELEEELARRGAKPKQKGARRRPKG